jgi:hypothetical protein
MESDINSSGTNSEKKAPGAVTGQKCCKKGNNRNINRTIKPFCLIICKKL